MKKPQKKDDGDANFRKLVIRNWIIFFAALAIAVFFYYAYPVIYDYFAKN